MCFFKNEWGVWGWGVWDLGMGVGGLAQPPNPKSPIPNPQSPWLFLIYFNFKIIKGIIGDGEWGFAIW